jgi:hypothetical protein
MPDETIEKTTGGSRWWNLLLAAPFVALLWVPFYSRIEPTILGIPFFHWFQLLWVVLTSVLIYIVGARTGEPRNTSSLDGDRP